MPKCKIDGVEYEFKPGETVIQIADRNGINIPRFCYHPALTVVAQCRMCAVEIEKMPKLQTACSTPAGDGMVVSTKSEKVKSMQNSVMEFLLINHPLDCPICDKSGECDLQNYSYDYGADDTRYEEQKRTYLALDMGPVIKKNMNRCIHCTRCIRFCDEVSGFREMIAVKRGNWTEITTQGGKPLETEYAGNLADICPTGSLTLKDFRFKKRVWFLKRPKSICEGCSQGCNIELHAEEGKIFRTLPRENLDVNKWWICDEGRFNFHYVNDDNRATTPTVKAQSTDWNSAVNEAKKILTGNILVLVGSDLSNEELVQVLQFSKSKLNGATVYHYGTPEHLKASDDKDEDKILRRTSKTANLHGAEKLGFKGYDGKGSYDSALIFRAGRAQIPSTVLKNVKGGKVLIGVHNRSFASEFDVFLPGCSWAEKNGTFTNHKGMEQKFEASIEPVGEAKLLDSIFGMWS